MIKGCLGAKKSDFFLDSEKAGLYSVLMISDKLSLIIHQKRQQLGHSVFLSTVG